VAKRKPTAQRRRAKLTIDMEADLKRRLLCYAGSRDEHVWRVVERAVERELGGFYFATRDQAGKQAAGSSADGPTLKIG
jgi:hypothetical protein